jgi:hypothetical protein
MDRIELKNDRKGDKELTFAIFEHGYPKKKPYVYIFVGNAGKDALPLIGYTDNLELVAFVKKLSAKT